MHWKFESPFRAVVHAAGRRFSVVREADAVDRWSLRIDGRRTGATGSLTDCMEAAVDALAAATADQAARLAA